MSLASVAAWPALVLASTGAVWTIPAAAAGSGVPANCNAMTPDVTRYLSKVLTARLEPPPVAGTIICDFTFLDGAPKAVVHLIAGSSITQLMEARAYAEVNGYATQSVPSLGKEAFSIARNHKPWGLMALSGSYVYYGVRAQFSFAKDIAFTRALFQLK